MTKPADTDDVLNAVSDLSDVVAARFDQQDARLFRIENDAQDLKGDMKDAKDKIDHIYGMLDSRIQRIGDVLLAYQMNVKLKYEQ